MRAPLRGRLQELQTVSDRPKRGPVIGFEAVQQQRAQLRDLPPLGEGPTPLAALNSLSSYASTCSTERSADHRSIRQWSMSCPRLIARACSLIVAISDMSSSSVIAA